MRCIACDKILSDMESQVKNPITKLYEEYCSFCRNISVTTNKYTEKEYQHCRSYQGLTRIPIDYYDNF